MSTLRLVRTLLVLLAVAALAALPLTLRESLHLTLVVLDLGPLGRADVGVALGVVPALLLLLVTGIGALVAAYSARNLAGQHRLHRFAALELVTVLALASAVVAPSLPQLAAGWTVGGLAVAGLVSHADTPASRRSRRVMVGRLLVGDLALWAAMVVGGVGLGTLDLGSLASATGTASTATVGLMAALVVVAGVSRSALVPLHRWLPETAEAPSPVSALLHAGLVNGVGVLALLLWPVLAASVPARGVLLVLAVSTALLGTAQMRTRPDVKGRLAASTSAQMGYLGVQVALGLPAAALAHLLGHGMWKATQFLGAGVAVERARQYVPHTTPRGHARPLRAALVAAVVVALASVVPGPWGPPLVEGPASLLPALLAALALSAATLGSWRLRTRAHAVALSASAAATVAYLLCLRALTTLTDSILVPATPDWGEPGATSVTALMVLLVAVGAGFWYLDRRAAAGRLGRLVDWVARTSLPPASPARAVTSGREVDAGLVAEAATPPDVAQVLAAQAVLRVASDLVAPLWPLESFVASNPLAPLEQFDFHDALEIGASTRGSATGPTADLFRLAWAAGRVDDTAIARAAAGLLDGRGATVAGVARLDIVRETLLHDDGSAPTSQWTRSSYVGLTCGRVYGATAWGIEPGGVWAAVRRDAGLDRVLATPGARKLALALPAEPEAAVAVLLSLTAGGIAEPTRVVGRVLASYAGWAAHVAWRLRQGVPVPGLDSADDDVDRRRARALADLVAALLFEDVVRGRSAGSLAGSVDTARVSAAVAESLGVPDAAVHDLETVVAEVRAAGVERLRLAAWEHAVHAPIAGGIAASARHLSALGLISAGRPAGSGADAQVVTCIDVRSERLRRRLEEVGPWETVGAAGFFGLPLRHVSPTGVVTERCPALIRPDRTVTETPRMGPWSWSTAEGGAALHAVEARPFAAFPLAEASGWLLGPLAALRTAAPAWWTSVTASVRRRVGAPLRGTLATVADASGALGGPATGDGFGVDELVDHAEGFLRGTGLVELAPLVMLCGHAGSAMNNPHLAAYDCGACGGQSGEVSARAMVQVLSDPRVAAGLLERGIDVSGTTFVAALHDTTRERVTVLDSEVEPDSVLARLVDDLTAATDLVVRERAAGLPQAPRGAGLARLRRHLDRRATDWAQVRPEWGLAGNAALVIGPRALTARRHLDGRVFLHSYRPDIDPDGRLLESVMAGPMVVGQWINMQYWCSTVDPDHFGAGDKTTHNVVVGADDAQHELSGVLTGARGDLRIGLPWQAVSAAAPIDGRWPALPHHDPVRLLVVVCARPPIIDAVLSRLPHVARLVGGGWIELRAVEPDTGEMLRFSPEGRWTPEEGAEAQRGEWVVADGWTPEDGETRDAVLDPVT